LGVSPCFLSKNAQKLPGYIERAAIPAYESSSKGIAFGMEGANRMGRKASTEPHGNQNLHRYRLYTNMIDKNANQWQGGNGKPRARKTMSFVMFVAPE
jgi:hypothetical protein